MNIGKSIKIVCAMKGLKLKDLAEKMDVNKDYLSRISGKTTCSPQMLEKLCAAVEMKASEFIALGENKG